MIQVVKDFEAYKPSTVIVTYIITMFPHYLLRQFFVQSSPWHSDHLSLSQNLPRIHTESSAPVGKERLSADILSQVKACEPSGDLPYYYQKACRQLDNQWNTY